MENTGSIFSQIIKDKLRVTGNCPKCSEPLYTWASPNAGGSTRSNPVCMKCGYHDIQHKADQKTHELAEKSIKARTVKMLSNGSIVTDTELLDKRLSDYKKVDQETTVAMNKTQLFIRYVLSGETKHLIFTGKSGSGKSHLSMAACWEIAEQSNYDKKCLFINYRELLEKRKNAFNDPEETKRLNQLVKDIKTVDLVVLDDLGAELGGTSAGNATNYNNDTLYSILEARQNKNLIVNTNLTSKEIRASYGERILSRISKHSEGLFMAFQNTKDKRMGME